MARTAAEATENVAKNTEKDLVTIKLPINRDKQDDVFVSVNGQTFKIQRGVEVQVPTFVKEVLDNSERMDTLAFNRQRELISKSK